MMDILSRSLTKLVPLAVLALTSCDPVLDEPTTPATRDEENAACVGSKGVERDSLFSGEGVYHDDHVSSETVRSFLVGQNGSLVFERYYNGGGPELANNLHSVTKGLTVLIVGAAVQDGFLPGVEVPIADYLPADLAAEPGAEGITVQHLLTMSAGLAEDESSPERFVEVESEPPFVRAILRQPRVFEPGSKIAYSTLSTYLLGAVVMHAVGSSCATTPKNASSDRSV